jgi:hypothetical protein
MANGTRVRRIVDVLPRCVLGMREGLGRDASDPYSASEMPSPPPAAGTNDERSRTTPQPCAKMIFVDSRRRCGRMTVNNE